MKAEYETTIKFKIIHEIDGLKNIAYLKTDREFAEHIAQMVCDEAIVAGGIVNYEIIESKVDIEPIEKSVTFFRGGNFCGVIVKGTSEEEIKEKVLKRFPDATGIHILR